MPKDLSTRLLQAGEGINQGLSQAGKSITEMDPEKIRADALQRQQALALQHQQLQMNQMKMMEMQKEVANKGINDIIVQGLQLDDPKAFDAYMNDRQGQLNQYYSMKGQQLSPSTFEMLKTSSEDYKVARGNLNMLYNKVLANRFGNSYRPVDVNPEQLSQLKSKLSKGPSELYQEDLKQLGEIQSMAQEQSKAQFNRETELEVARIKAENQAKQAKTKADQVKFSSQDIKPLSDMDELISKSNRLQELAQKPENAKMFGLSGGQAQADLPVVGAIKRSTFSADQLELYQKVKQLRTDYEKAQGGVREVANVNMQKAIAQNIPKGNLTRDQFISSMASFNMMNKMLKAQKAASLVRIKAGKDPDMMQAALDRLELEPDVSQMAVKILNGQKLDMTDLGGSQKQIVKKLYSPSRNQTKLIYSDGSEEVVSGKQ